MPNFQVLEAPVLNLDILLFLIGRSAVEFLRFSPGFYCRNVITTMMILMAAVIAAPVQEMMLNHFPFV